MVNRKKNKKKSTTSVRKQSISQKAFLVAAKEVKSRYCV